MKHTKHRTLTTIPVEFIASCGMNCRLCLAHQREKNHCPPCRGDDAEKSNYCVTCIIKNCDFFAEGKAKCCFECAKYPCRRLRRLDKRYRTKYHMSMLDNLVMIRESGVRAFIRSEKDRWTCSSCGNLRSVHRPHCLFCGK